MVYWPAYNPTDMVWYVMHYGPGMTAPHWCKCTHKTQDDAWAWIRAQGPGA